MNKIAFLIALPIVMFMLSGCGDSKAQPVRTISEKVYVKVPERCPTAEERARLRAARPVPLSRSPAPATARQRTAQTSAQLGRYEAPGGWGDQVDAVLDRCQQP